MNRLARGTVLVGVALLLTVSSATIVSGSQPASLAEPNGALAGSSGASQRVTIDYHVSVAPAPAEAVRVVATVDAPPSVTEMEVAFDDSFEVVSVDGADPTGENTYRTEASRAVFTYDVPVPDRASAAGSNSQSVRGEDWAFVYRRSVRATVRWWYTGTPPEARRTLSVEDGVASETVALVGEVTTERLRGEDGEPTVTVAHLEEYPPSMSPASIASVIHDTDDRHRVGAPPDELYVFSIPTPYGGPAGFSVADSIAIRDDRFWDGLLVHEYVHSKQRYSESPRMEWLVEAESFYYMALYPTQRGTMSERQFRSRLSVEREGMKSRTLADPAGSSFAVSATKGVAVLAALDATVREATGGERTLVDVLARLNEDPDTVTYEDFRRATVRVGGDSLGPWVDAHVAGNAFPTPVSSVAALPEPGWTLEGGSLQVCRADAVVSGGAVEVPAGSVVTVAHSGFGDLEPGPALERIRDRNVCPNQAASDALQSIDAVRYASYRVSDNATVELGSRHGGGSVERHLTVLRRDAGPTDGAASGDSTAPASAGTAGTDRDATATDTDRGVGTIRAFLGPGADRALEAILGLRGWSLVGVLAVLGTLLSFALKPS